MVGAVTRALAAEGGQEAALVGGSVREALRTMLSRGEAELNFTQVIRGSPRSWSHP